MRPLGRYQSHTIPTAYIALAFRGRREFLPWWRTPFWRRLLTPTGRPVEHRPQVPLRQCSA